MKHQSVSPRVGRFITVVDQANYSGVIGEFNEGVCVIGQHAALCVYRLSVDCQGGRVINLQPDLLRTVGSEVSGPAAHVLIDT